jgi:hypothetical protein
MRFSWIAAYACGVTRGIASYTGTVATVYLADLRERGARRGLRGVWCRRSLTLQMPISSISPFVTAS